jgi:hypothetical protein
MRRIIAAALIVLCSVGVSIGQAAGKDDHKVLLCHATNAADNPYVLIEVDVHGAAGHLNAGHGDSTHTDFLLPDGQSDCSDDGEL